MTKSKKKTTPKKSNTNSSDNKSLIIMGIIAFALLVLMIIFWIKHGTYSLGEEPSYLTISCPAEAHPGDTVKCSVTLNTDGAQILSINANYDIAPELEYNTFMLDDECEGEMCFDEYANTENGFAVVNLNGVNTNRLIGNLFIHIPDSITVDNSYKVGLKNVELSDDAFEMIEAPNTSVNIQVVADGSGDTPTPTPGDDTPTPTPGGEEPYTEDQIIPRVPHGITYATLKTQLNLRNNVTLISHDEKEINDSSLVRTSDKIQLSNGVKLTISVLGDINCDGFVRVSDVSVLYRHVNDREYITKEEILLAGDINHDTHVRVADVAVLYRYVNGRINSLEVVE